MALLLKDLCHTGGGNLGEFGEFLLRPNDIITGRPARTAQASVEIGSRIPEARSAPVFRYSRAASMTSGFHG